MVKNWLDPYNFIFSITFILTGIIFPFPKIQSYEYLFYIMRIGMLVLGTYLLIGTLRRSFRKNS